MKKQYIQANFEVRLLLDNAFEEGYRLGRHDRNDSVFIDIPLLIAEFSYSLDVNFVIIFFKAEIMTKKT